jgi:hypothetical protein
MDYSKFDLMVNKILGESLQGGKVSSMPSAMGGVGATTSNVPPSPEPQITTAQKPFAATPSTPRPSSVTLPKASEQDIKNEISKLPTDVQNKIASAKSVDEISQAIANVDPTSKQKIEDFIKGMGATAGQTGTTQMQNLPPVGKNPTAVA